MRQTGRSPDGKEQPDAAGSATSDEEFDGFFRRVFPRAVAIAQRVTGDRASAEDAALEALAKAHFRWNRIATEPLREFWVTKVTVNEAIRRLPKARGVLGDQLSISSDPADQIVLRRTLTAALGALPRRQCEVIVLRYVIGLSETEVASTLQISHGTVKTHLRRGISGLRETVGRNLKEEHLARLA